MQFTFEKKAWNTIEEGEKKSDFFWFFQTME